MTSGGGIAIEDAVVLSEELRRTKDVDTTLQAYVDRRFDRVSQMYEITREISRLERQPTPDGEQGMKLMMEGHRTLAEPF